MTARFAAMALGNGRGVTASWAATAHPDAAQLESFTFDAGAFIAGDESTLSAALTALRRGATPARTLHVALAAPWTSPREVALPSMRSHEARAVLTRDVTRHFPTPRSMPVIGVRALRAGAWLACEADGIVLDVVMRAARHAGFDDVRFAAAVGAWAHAAGSASGRVFAVDGEAAVIHAARGRITRLRRCRTADLGLPAPSPAPTDALPEAARHAPWNAEPELVSAGASRAREAQVVSTVRQLARIGLVSLAAAGALLWWGGQRRVATLEARREALRPALQPVLAARDSLTYATDILDELARAERDAPRWSERVWTLASVLPDDAHFTSWRGEGDSLVIEGRAGDAAAVMERLRMARGVDGIRAAVAVDDTGDHGAAFRVMVRFRTGGVR